MGLSEETKRKIGRKNRVHMLRVWKDKEYRARQKKNHMGQKAWNKGLPSERQPCYNKKMSKETKKKISEANIGRKFTKAHIKKLSLAKLGKPQHRNTLRAIKEYYSNPKVIKKCRERMLGKELSEETKKKQSKSLKRAYREGRKKKLRWMLGRKHTLEAINKIKQVRAKQILPIKDTRIEVKMQGILKRLHIEFFTHYYISGIKHSYRCDIFIPTQKGINKNIIIECDGCYWHGCPICNLKKQRKLKGVKERDSFRNKELENAGYAIIRFWGHEINSKGIRQKVIRRLKNYGR